MKKIIKDNHQSTLDSEAMFDNTFPIVAIGASAGGLNALIDFFNPIPAQCNMAFVVVTHLNRDHKSMMPELIQSHTPMPVVTIEQACTIEPNHIYILPPNKNVITKDGKLILVNQNEPHYLNLPINYFFHFLALDYTKNAVAVVLSGCGSDGSMGLCEIKQHGGIVIAQAPQSALYDSMPINAINTGMVDSVETPEKIFIEINRLRKKSALLKSAHATIPPTIFNLLQEKSGNDFTGYKTSVLKRRIEKQLKRLHLNNMTDYLAYLQNHENEVDILFQELLIGVTSFFRDPDAFKELKQFIIPSILNSKPNHFTFRGWVPGCSTGQEAYSIAIVLREHMEETHHYFHVQLFCTDIDPVSLEFARTGLYPNSIANDMSAERLSTYFVKEKLGYRIIKEIREMIIFGLQNIIQDPPFTKQDFISCRNLLIYLNTTSQRVIFPLLHFSLNPDGVLFLGKSESACQYRHLFKPCYGKTYKFFNKMECPQLTRKKFKTFSKKIELGSAVPLLCKVLPTNNLAIHHAISRILMKSTVTPCVLINNQGNIIFKLGDLSDYFYTTAHLMHAHLVDVVKPPIEEAIQPFLNDSGAIEITKSITKTLPDLVSTAFFIQLIFTPVPNIEGLKDLILIHFKKTLNIKGKSMKHTRDSNQRILDLENELHLTKETLQSTIEELEASNEEMQSTNEEIQSINEELETSKEELQAVNEELIIVNTELQNRIDETSAINEDMNSLFNNAHIAAIFLDKALTIKQFTPKTQALINLIPADVGRSFRHFSNNIKNINLIQTVENVLGSQEPQTIEVQANNGYWYFMTISTYRTPSNVVDGIVITFMEITQNKLNEVKIGELNQEVTDAAVFLNSVFDALRECIVVLNNDMTIHSANTSFCKCFSLKYNEIIGASFYEVGNKQWDIPGLKVLLNEVSTENRIVNDYVLEHGNKKLYLNARKTNLQGERSLIILAVEACK